METVKKIFYGILMIAGLVVIVTGVTIMLPSMGISFWVAIPVGCTVFAVGLYAVLSAVAAVAKIS